MTTSLIVRWTPLSSVIPKVNRCCNNDHLYLTCTATIHLNLLDPIHRFVFVVIQLQKTKLKTRNGQNIVSRYISPLNLTASNYVQSLHGMKSLNYEKKTLKKNKNNSSIHEIRHTIPNYF